VLWERANTQEAYPVPKARSFGLGFLPTTSKVFWLIILPQLAQTYRSSHPAAGSISLPSLSQGKKPSASEVFLHRQTQASLFPASCAMCSFVSMGSCELISVCIRDTRCQGRAHKHKLWQLSAYTPRPMLNLTR
jgi:hypothetical protein